LPRSAETALHGVLLDKGLLDRMELAILLQPFDSRNGAPLALDCQL
jgi:hypothetical protein